MYELSDEELKRSSKFGIKDEDLKYLVEVIKFLYKEEVVDSNGNIVIDEKNGKPKLVDSKRRSGKPKYTHPYNVAAFLYKKGYSREYIITALFHDVLEDTKYKEDDIRKILENYLNKYPDIAKNREQAFIDEILEAVNCVTKKDKISRPKAPILKLKQEIVLNKIRIVDVTVHNLLDRGYIPVNIEGNLFRVPVTKEDITEESILELNNYENELEQYNNKMSGYINEVKKSEIAKIVKVADRISNLTDFSPTDDSNWLEKYIRESSTDCFLDLAKKTDLEDDFTIALNTAILTKEVLERHEHGNKNELRIIKRDEESR